MSKTWKIIIAIVLVSLLLGAVCMGVGLMTGGSLERIFANLDDKYHVQMYLDWGGESWQILREAMTGQTPAA